MKLRQVHDGFYRGRNLRTVFVQSTLQRSLSSNNYLAVDLSERLYVFSPQPFEAAMDAQRIYSTHKVNLADMSYVIICLRRICVSPVRSS